MSDQPENTNAETSQFEAVQAAPVEAAQPVAAAVQLSGADKAKTSNRRVIGAAIAGAVAVAVIALAGVIGFAIGSHHGDDRAGFGAGGRSQIAQNFERHHDQMMQGFGEQQPQQGQSQQQPPEPGSMMAPNQQDQGPGQFPRGMLDQHSNQ